MRRKSDGEVFEGEPLHKLLLQAVRHGDDPAVQRHLQTVIDDRVGQVVQRLVEERALYPQVYQTVAHERYYREVQRARARRLQPYFVEAFFKDAFGRAGGKLIAVDFERCLRSPEAEVLEAITECHEVQRAVVLDGEDTTAAGYRTPRLDVSRQ